MQFSGAGDLSSTFNSSNGFFAPQFAHQFLPISIQPKVDSRSSANASVVSVLPNSNVLLPLPLASSCSFCTETVVGSRLESIVQVPVQINLPTGMPLLQPSGLPHWNWKPHKPLENELLSRSPPPYLPQPLSSGTKKKTDQDRNHKNAAGLSKWYLKRRHDQLLVSSIAKNRLQRNQKGLKRLNNNIKRICWKMDKRQNFSDQESIRESKLEMLRKRGFKAPCKTECTLWNCPRKEFKRKRPFMPMESRMRSLSRLSNLSKKSRSPIIFHRSP